MNDEHTPIRAPIYVSYLTFTNLLDWLHEVGTLPTVLDRSFWGSKFSGSTGTQLMSGLRFLNLLDGEKVTGELEELALADREGRKPLIADVLRKAYGAPLVAELPKMTPRMLSDAMKELGTTDATHQKALSFFINAAKAVELPVPPSIAKQARNRPPTSRKATKRKKADVSTVDETPSGDATDRDPPPPPDGASDLPKGIPAALLPLLSDLAKVGPSWTQADHDRWLATFTAVLDYALPPKEVPGD